MHNAHTALDLLAAYMVALPLVAIAGALWLDSAYCTPTRYAFGPALSAAWEPVERLTPERVRAVRVIVTPAPRRMLSLSADVPTRPLGARPAVAAWESGPGLPAPYAHPGAM